jgi:hypothetical protein
MEYQVVGLLSAFITVIINDILQWQSSTRPDFLLLRLDKGLSNIDEQIPSTIDVLGSQSRVSAFQTIW